MFMFFLAAMMSVTPVPTVELQLTEAPMEYGQRRFSLVLVNTGTSAVTLVKPGDGSVVGWRTPVITWTVEPLDELAQRSWSSSRQPGRCGNMNALTTSEIFTLQPGQRQDISAWANPDVLPEGRFRLTVRYVNDPHRPWKDGSAHDSAHVEAMQRVRRSTPLTVVSNALELVAPPAPVRSAPEMLLPTP